MIRIPDFTKFEIDRIKLYANFTKSEEMLFDLRNMEYSLEICAEEMNVSYTTVRRINKKMIDKVIKTLDYFKNNK